MPLCEHENPDECPNHGLRPRVVGEREYPTLRFFDSSHLSPELAAISAKARDLAQDMAVLLADSAHQAEVHAGLRKLLEAKDCFVRAALP